MVFEREGSGLDINGTSHRVGMKVVATNESEYEGLCGVITEIRTGEDLETENEGPDIYCCFDPPDDKESILALEKVFSALYCCRKTLDEISLDLVIMAPEMIEPLVDQEDKQ